MPDVIILVRATPRGGKDAVIGVRAGTLHVRVSAPPIDGAANRACVELVARTFGLRRAQVSLCGGETSRDKRFTLAGITPEAAAARLAELPALPQP